MSGLEVIGSVASVLQLAATVYAISKTLYEVGDALSNAPSDIKDLARDLETFAEELHLLSALLDDKTHRYSDRVYKLTAKIIGDCASICVKIDRILRKLRSGSFLARVKWVFKEKEIMKLLARLRDLKLSLMGTLSLLSALKADCMMDAMGVGNPSLLGGPSEDALSRETAEEVEETRRKLESISNGQAETSFGVSLSGTTLTASTTRESKRSRKSLDSLEKEAEEPGSSQSLSAPATSLQSATRSRERAISREVGPPSSSIFISAMTMPKSNAFAQLPQAMESVQSFYSAFSRHDIEDLESPEPPADRIQRQNTDRSSQLPAWDKPLSAHVADQAQGPTSPIIAEWRAEMAEVAMKRFNMSHEAAEYWASSILYPPDLKDSSSSSRQLSSVPPMEAATSMSVSSSPGKPISPHTPHTLAIPSRLSANSIAEYSAPRRISERSRTTTERLEDVADNDQANELGTNAIDIPTSPRPYYPHNRRSSSVAQQHRNLVEEDLGDLPFGIHRSTSLGADDREPPSLSALLGLQAAENVALTSSPSPPRLLQPAPHISESSSAMSRQQSSSLEARESEAPQIPRGLSLGSMTSAYRLRLGRIGGRGATPPTGSSSSLLDRPGGSTTSERAGGGRYIFPRNYETDDESLLFDMSEIGRDHGRRSIEEPRGGGNIGGDRGGFEAAPREGDSGSSSRRRSSSQEKVEIPKNPKTKNYLGKARVVADRDDDDTNDSSISAGRFLGNHILREKSKPYLLGLAPEIEGDSDDGLAIKYPDRPPGSQSTPVLERNVVSKENSRWDDEDEEYEDGKPNNVDYLILGSPANSTGGASGEDLDLEAELEETLRETAGTVTCRRAEEVEGYKFTDALPGQWVSDGEYSDDSDNVRTKREVKDSDERSRSPHHKRRLAEGALAGAGAAALMANHKKAPYGDGRRVIGGAALGAISAEVLTRARSRYREDDERRGRSRSGSSSRNSHKKLKSALGLATVGLAAAAGTKYVQDREQNGEAIGRGRSRTRSASRRRLYSLEYQSHGSDLPRVTGVVRSSYHDRDDYSADDECYVPGTEYLRSRSKSRIRTGAETAASGLAVAAVRRLYESRQQMREMEENSRRLNLAVDYSEALQDMKLVKISCLTCRRRKLRCDYNHPCDRCSARGDALSCAYSLPILPLKEKRGVYHSSSSLVPRIWMPTPISRSQPLQQYRVEIPLPASDTYLSLTIYRLRAMAFDWQVWQYFLDRPPRSSVSSRALPTSPSASTLSMPTSRIALAGPAIANLYSWVHRARIGERFAPPPIYIKVVTPALFLRYLYHYIYLALYESWKRRQEQNREGQSGSGNALRLLSERLEDNRRRSPEDQVFSSPRQNALGSLNCEEGRDTDDETDAWMKRQKDEKRRRRRSAGSVQKRSLPQSIGSDTDDEDLMPVILEGADEARISSMGLKRKNVKSLLLDNPWARTTGEEQVAEEINYDTDDSDDVGDKQKWTKPPFYAQADMDADLGTNSVDDSSLLSNMENPTKVEQPLFQNDDLHSNKLHRDLWFRAFAQLSAQDLDNSEALLEAWSAAQGGPQGLPGTSEDLVAKMAAARLETDIDWARSQLLKAPTEFSKGLFQWIPSSVDRFYEILKVMRKTLRFKTGAFVWTCLCSAEQRILGKRSTNEILGSKRVLPDLSEIATLVARYNILESMYRQWPGMTLEENFEKALIELCMQVLRYLDLVLSMAPGSEQEASIQQRLETLMTRIKDADTACRGFSVTIISVDEVDGGRITVEDVSADDDSDFTEMGDGGHGLSVEHLPVALPVKV